LKILITTPIIPNKNNIRIDYVNEVINFLQTKVDVTLYWLVFQPKKFKNYNSKNSIILDIHDFSNANELINKIKPDIFLSNHTLDFINYSLSLVSRSNKIPIICFEHSFFNPIIIKQKQNKKTLFLFSQKLPSEKDYEKIFLGRFRFYFLKYSFLVKTRISLGIDFFQIMSIIRDTLIFFTGKISKLNPFGDQYLITSDFLSKNYLDKNKEIIHVVGNPYWDKISKKIRQKNIKNISEPPKILIVTGSLYEHGYWTKKQRDEFLTKLFTTLSKHNLFFALKIHPSSENKQFYKELSKKLNLEFPIFQDENLWDIAYDFDIMISYGYSQAITEMAYSGHKLIFLDSKIEIPESPLLSDAIKEGNILACKDVRLIPSLIHSFLKTTINLSNNFEESCNSVFAKSDGKSAERISKIILNMFN
jgi:hypothetical protein